MRKLIYNENALNIISDQGWLCNTSWNSHPSFLKNGGTMGLIKQQVLNKNQTQTHTNIHMRQENL